jgi:hypothetical protein
VRLLRTFLIGTLALAAPAEAGAADLKLCEDIAAKLRADRAFAAPGSKLLPLEALSGIRFVDVASASHRTSVDDKNATAYVATLAVEYKADAKLADAMKDQVSYQYDDIWSLPGSDVHTLTSTSGTASCSQFLFFQAGHPLPDPPASMQGGMNDGQDQPGQIFECYHSRGDLARIGGQIVFAATDFGFENDNVVLRMVPLVNGRWGTGCQVTTEFEIRYGVTGAHVAKGGPLGRADVAKLAVALARAKDTAQNAKRDFSFGPPIGERASFVAAVRAVKDGKIAVDDEFPFFGDAEDLTGFGLVNDADAIGMIIGGREYLLRIAHPAIGWRDMPGYLMIFYDFRTGKPVAVASASVSAGRGAVKSVRVSELK